MNLFKRSYKIVDKNPYDNKPLQYKGLVIKSGWKDKYTDLILKENIKALFLNYSLGWQCVDYSFLERIPKITEIDIIDSESNGIKSLEYQNELEDIGLNIPDSYSIDFTGFYKLTTLFTYGRKRNDSLYRCTSLKDLYIDEFKVHDDHYLGNLINLRKLTIANSNLTHLEFLENLNKLETLELFNCKKIRSFVPVSSLDNLRKLDISGYKSIGDISFLSNLKNLEVLLIDGGAVESISPLRNLLNLKALSIYGNEALIKDGHLEVINNLNNLSILDIPNKKSYNYKINNYWNWDDFGKPRKDWLTKKSDR